MNCILYPYNFKSILYQAIPVMIGFAFIVRINGFGALYFLTSFAIVTLVLPYFDSIGTVSKYHI